jgi:4-hydroxybenzoyl-CoA thioesterase
MTTHQHPLRVYYEDTDAQAIVYYANYFKFMERARTEMLRAINFQHPERTEDGLNYFVVGELNARYKASAKLDDELIVESSVLNIGGASLKLRQNVLKRVASGDSLLLEGVVTLIYIAESGKPVRIPQNLRDAFAPYLVPDLV